MGCRVRCVPACCTRLCTPGATLGTAPPLPAPASRQLAPASARRAKPASLGSRLRSRSRRSLPLPPAAAMSGRPVTRKQQSAWRWLLAAAMLQRQPHLQATKQGPQQRQLSRRTLCAATSACWSSCKQRWRQSSGKLRWRLACGGARRQQVPHRAGRGAGAGAGGTWGPAGGRPSESPRRHRCRCSRHSRRSSQPALHRRLSCRSGRSRHSRCRHSQQSTQRSCPCRPRRSRHSRWRQLTTFSRQRAGRLRRRKQCPG